MTAITSSLDGGSRLHSRHDEFDPPTRGVGLVGKFAVFAGLTAVAMVATEPMLLWGLLTASLILMLSTGLHAKTLWAAVKPLSPVILLLFVFSGLFYDPEAARTPFARTVLLPLVQTDFIALTVSVGGILVGVAFIAKLLLMMSASIYMIGTTPMEQLLAALQKMRVPNAIGLMMSTAVRFIPTMTGEVATIKDAQRARGAGASAQKGARRQPVQGTLPLFVPMIVSSMRRADTMAMSMVSRGYGFAKERTVLTSLHVSRWDYLVVGVMTLAVAAFFVLRSQIGLGSV
ncbi:energy-coupling factor transporter transmembrane component T family protein [Microbacterium sp. RD1]|uniref:energy-coupling factor transporter transmembrane component T family protein n=1 Tax=Microbacterium sp. RD1 TaxID=3457313 RepID=UPI003FA5874C